MDTKNKTIIIITTLAIVIFLSTLSRALWYAPTNEILLPEEAILRTSGDPASYPILISIPKINVDAKVQKVGITEKGNMSTPDNYTDVGWYKYGILPGQEGSAVFAGHVDDGLSLKGVFYNLKDLNIGDDVYVATQGEMKLHFIVNKIETFAFDDRNTDVFTKNDGKLIKLITCTGTWVQENKTHDKRLVVTAELSP